MGKSIIGLVAVIGAATPLAAAQAAVTPNEAAHALHASSVAELLNPVPNAVAVLNTLDAQQPAQTAAKDEGVQLAQWHHHHWHRRWHHHHHHFWRPFWHHHHHWHHHHWHHHHHWG